ncbi:MAG: pyrroline-5-carboxylate reductase [Candidatus Handelsmanbacteria bacterium]|nr:pyrroline-5-carboxylate reductase [Candidatus Handelsmanbacteria bacterium]
MTEECKIGVIGAGNMGGALLSGLVAAGLPPAHLTATDLREAVLQPLSQLGVRISTRAEDAILGQQVVVLGVKPQSAPELFQLVKRHLRLDQVLVSIMAGVSTATIESQWEAPIPVVRVMPQTLAQLGAAASGICGGRHATPAQVELVRALFDRVGSTALVAEYQMDAVTGLSGSGPAYIYTVLEALADGGVRVGLSREVALKLAAQTALGAARMVLESGQHPAVLRDQVTSPGGTTIAGLHKLEEKGLRDALISAVQAATERSAQLGQT